MSRRIQQSGEHRKVHLQQVEAVDFLPRSFQARSRVVRHLLCHAPAEC
jgi:hypothetical protein